MRGKKMQDSFHIKLIGDTLGNLPVLVFLHDSIGSVTQWKDYPQKLCELTGLPGFVYDRQGHGLSPALSDPREADYMHRYAFEEMPRVIQTHLPDKKLILVGHSDGGSIALLYASRFPEHTLGVITMAAHVLVEEITLNGIKDTAKLFETDDWMDKLEKHHGDKTQTLFDAWWKTWTSTEFRDWNIRDCLGDIHCPVLAIQGEDDNYGTEDQVDRILYGIEAYGEKFIIPSPCGHAPWKKHPDLVNTKILEFIQERVLPQ